MGSSVAHKLIEAHLVDGEMTPGAEIALRIDQTLTQDATGTLVMLEFEAMGLTEVRTELSAQYVDHNLLQADFRNADDHLFLRSACAALRALVLQARQRRARIRCTCSASACPGKTLLGSDSHTCAAGSLGMLAIGAGGLDVAMAMAGEPFYVRMPEIWGVRLTGELPDWVSAKDVILEMLRRHDVDGGLGRIVEYHGPGPRRPQRDGPARDRQHGRRARRDHDACSRPTTRSAASWPPRGARTTGSSCCRTRTRRTTSRTRSTCRELEPLIALPSSPGKVSARARGGRHRDHAGR